MVAVAVLISTAVTWIVSKRTSATGAASEINGAANEITNPGLVHQYPDRPYGVQDAVGIDVSKLLEDWNPQCERPGLS